MQEVFKFLWQALKNYRWYYLFMLCAPICGAFYRPIVYYAIKLMVDIISTSQVLTFNQLLVPLAIYLVADVFLSTMWRTSQVALWCSEPYVQRGIILTALHRILSYRYSYFQNTPTGSLVSKIKGLLDGYAELWAQLYYGIAFWFLASITTGGSIFLVSPKLGIIILSWSVVFLLINYFLAQKVNILSANFNSAKHQVMGKIADSLANIHSIKLFARRNYEQQRLSDTLTGEFMPKEIKLYKFHFKVDVLNDILGIGILLFMLVIMIKLRVHKQISVGDFVFVFGMMFQFQENLWHLMQEFHKLSDKMGDLKSSLAIYKADVDEYQIEASQKIESNTNTYSGVPVGIEFKSVKFSYKDHKQIFNNLNLQIKPGEKIGIVGYTGAGKTTLINLLLKIFTPDYGQILINGREIASIDSDELRELIAMIPQDISLFHRSLLDNISYGKPDADYQKVIQASRKANAHEFISKLPNQYATMVGERGVKLSGGQRQRIAIARAILKDAPILILDEATSSLDSITEQYIQTAIEELLAGKTVLAIAHRLSTLKTMDRLIVINQGEIVETGTHDELLARENSQYARIWYSQYA